MREIKFRAFVNGAMWNVNGLACSDESEHMDLIDHSTGGYENVYDFDLTKDCILMQFTGLRDKNGTEIYDGDIVNAWSQGYKGRFEVKWRQEGSPCWILYPAWKNNEFWKIHGTMHEDGQFYDKGLEVIGNIYENPELLEGDLDE